MFALIVSLMPFVVVPLWRHHLHRHGRLSATIDGFAHAALIGVLATHLLPESYEVLGIHVVWATAIGYALVWLLHSYDVTHRMNGQNHQDHQHQHEVKDAEAGMPHNHEHEFEKQHNAVNWLSVLVVFAVCLCVGVHAIIDGAALALQTHSLWAITLAVFWHRVPVMLFVWQDLGALLKGWFAVFFTITYAMGTVLGYFGMLQLSSIMTPYIAMLLQSVLVGSLIHWILHAHHFHVHERVSSRWFGFILGAIAFLVTFWLFDHGHH